MKVFLAISPNGLVENFVNIHISQSTCNGDVSSLYSILDDNFPSKNVSNQSFTTNFQNQGLRRDINNFKEGKKYSRDQGGKNNSILIKFVEDRVHDSYMLLQM